MPVALNKTDQPLCFSSNFNVYNVMEVWLKKYYVSIKKLKNGGLQEVTL